MSPDVTEFFLLRCGVCDLDMPFPTHEARMEWLSEHRDTGHETYLLWKVIR